jgi:hypothetical protein
MALKVANCESQLDPTKIGDKQMAKWSYGLFQINRTWHDYDEDTLLNPIENVKIARKIYDASGGNFDRWTCGRMLINQS